MMRSMLTEEQVMLQDLVRNVMEKECPRNVVEKMDEEEIYPEKLYKAMGEVGILGVPFPEEYGGSGMGMMEVAIILEEAAKTMVAGGEIFILSIVNAGLKILKFGTDEQKQKFLPELAQGNLKFCYSLTEPNAGSDLSSLSTRAVADGENFIVNGAKVFSTQAHVADWILAAVRTSDPDDPRKGISMLLIDPKSEGVVIRKIKKMGQKPVATCEIFFEDVVVPQSNLLGGIDQGWDILQTGFEKGRAGTAAIATGIARAALDDAVAYAKERVQFKKPIIKHQAIQQILADMAIRVNASQLLVHNAARKIDAGIPCMKDCSMAKVYATDSAMANTTDGIQVLGGYGYTMEYAMQRYFRDCKILQIAGGSNQIQRTIISGYLARE